MIDPNAFYDQRSDTDVPFIFHSCLSFTTVGCFLVQLV